MFAQLSRLRVAFHILPLFHYARNIYVSHGKLTPQWKPTLKDIRQRTKSYDVTIQMKALCLYLHVVLFIFQNFKKMLSAKFGSNRVKDSQIQCIGSKERQGPTLRVRFIECLKYTDLQKAGVCKERVDCE